MKEPEVFDISELSKLPETLNSSSPNLRQSISEELTKLFPKVMKETDSSILVFPVPLLPNR
jgi:hypothetical protein